MDARATFGSRIPSARAEKNTVLKSRHIDIVNSKVCPIERCLNRLERGRLVHLMNLGDIKYGLRTVDLFEVSNDFENGRLSPVEVQTRVRLKRVSPWRGEEDYDKAIRRVFLGAHKMLVTALD